MKTCAKVIYFQGAASIYLNVPVYFCKLLFLKDETRSCSIVS